MEYIVSSGEMKRCDTYTIEKIGMPSMVLMERAALSVIPELCDGTFDLRRVAVICGAGNNGGDGLAVARLLYLRGIAVDVLFVGDKKSCTKETQQQMTITQNYGIKIYNEINFNEYTTIIDSLFGIGLVRNVEGIYADIIERANKSKADILAIDIPSGISADTGQVMGIAIKAKKTVTFAYNKVGLVLYPGAEYAGEVIVKDIGIRDIGFDNNYPKVFSYTKNDLNKIPKRNPYSNKGSFGKVLVIGGFVNMSGAAYFSAKAAYRMGAGLVRIYTPDENRQIFQTMLPEAILTTYNENNLDISALCEAISWASVIVMGPGSGQGDCTLKILEILLSKAKVPLIIDADGINCIAKNQYLIKNNHNNIIFTPHLGEMARLTGKNVYYLSTNLIKEAKDYAKEHRLICVLKDTKTIVANGEGLAYLNQSGDNGMATAGSGDVLTGIIAGLIAQGMNLFQGAALGVYIHGLAGEFAASKIGSYSLMADDILDNIQEVRTKVS